LGRGNAPRCAGGTSRVVAIGQRGYRDRRLFARARCRRPSAWTSSTTELRGRPCRPRCRAAVWHPGGGPV